MAKYRNKKTGMVWEVGDPTTLSRVKADPATYEPLEPEPEPEKPAKAKKGGQEG